MSTSFKMNVAGKIENRFVTGLLIGQKTETLNSTLQSIKKAKGRISTFEIAIPAGTMSFVSLAGDKSDIIAAHVLRQRVVFTNDKFESNPQPVDAIMHFFSAN